MRKRLAVLLALVFAPWEAEAATFCALSAPTMERAGDHLQLKLTLTCSGAAASGLVPYPDSDLYVGATLYEVDPRLKDKIISIGDYGDVHANNMLDLKAVEMRPVMRTVPIVFDVASLGSYTHVLVAVWSEKSDCPGPVPGGNGCADFGYTLGPMDWFGMPIPVDALPRPICDKEALAANGYFDWVSESGDPTANTMPEQFSDSFNLNDCWAFVGDVGLGYSVRRWRVAPIPKPAT